VSAVHVILGVAMIVANAVAAVWGAFVWRGTLAPGRWFAHALALSHTLAIGVAALGLLMLSGETGKPGALHEIYGFLPAGIVVLAYTSRTEDQRRNVLVFAVAAAAIAGLGLRAATTGR
jgi:hypothetical protein